MANDSEKKETSMEDMIQFGISRVIEAFGKGENLHGAMWLIVNSSARWGIENEKRRQAERVAEDKKHIAAEKRKKKA